MASAVRLIEIEGRQTLTRHGVFFAKIGKYRRSVYQQLDGRIILGDECTCLVEWWLDLNVTRRIACPIDEHRIAALGECSESAVA